MRCCGVRREGRALTSPGKRSGGTQSRGTCACGLGMALHSPQCQLPGGTQSLLAWCRDRLLGVETEAWTGWVPSDARELRSERVRPPPRIRKPHLPLCELLRAPNKQRRLTWQVVHYPKLCAKEFPFLVCEIQRNTTKNTSPLLRRSRTRAGVSVSADPVTPPVSRFTRVQRCRHQ